MCNQCNVPLKFKGCTIKLFPLKDGNVDWNSTWNLKWKEVLKDGDRRWRDGSHPFKSVKRGLLCHWEKHHVGKILSMCVQGSISMLEHSGSESSEERDSSSSDEYLVK